MRIIYEGDRLVGTATDEYPGPLDWIDAPEDFEIGMLDTHKLVDGELVLRVPATITRAQGKVALIQAQKWPAVLAFVAAIEDPVQKAMADVALNDTLEWRRDSEFLIDMAHQLGLTDEDLDNLFFNASKVNL